MTCDHVLGLIDAGPFVNYPSAHLEAAWAHARGCASCGPALRLATALANDLSAMPQPEPPPHLAPAVLARIARLQPSAAAGSVGTPVRASRGSVDYAAALAGLVAACVIALSIAAGDGPPIDVTSPRIGGTTGLLGLERTITGWLTLAIGLVFYLAGLFAPVRSPGRHER